MSERRSRSTPVDPNAYPICSVVFSLDPRQSECVVYVPGCVFVRRLSIQTRFMHAGVRSRSTHTDPNAFPTCLNALSLNTRRSKHFFRMLKCALARPQSVQMRFLLLKQVLSLDAYQSKRIFRMPKCALARPPPIQMRCTCAQVCSRCTPVAPNARHAC